MHQLHTRKKYKFMKTIIQKYKKSINEAGFSERQILILWDFYVTKSMSSTAAQCRKPSDYGIKQLNINSLMKTAGISDGCSKFLLADTMKKTLKAMDLSYSGKKGAAVEIDIDRVRIAFTTPYSISDDEPPKAKEGYSHAKSLFIHMRNAFAHGNTYFFDNGNALFEDRKDSNVTAMILINKKTLLDWIVQVDSAERFYKHPEVLGVSKPVL